MRVKSWEHFVNGAFPGSHEIGPMVTCFPRASNIICPLLALENCFLSQVLQLRFCRSSRWLWSWGEARGSGPGSNTSKCSHGNAGYFFFQTKSFSDYFRPLINFQIFGKVGVSHFYLRSCCCCGGWDLHGISLRSGCLTSAAVIWFWKLSLGLSPSPSLVNHVFWKVLY